MEELIEQIRGMKLDQFLLSTTVTLASLVFGKLDAGELDESRLGIDALAALVPLLEATTRRDLGADARESPARLRGRGCRPRLADRPTE